MPDEETATAPGNFPKRRHKFALAAFILGIVSIAIPVLVPCAIAALVLGSIAIHQVSKDPEHLRGKGLAIVGVATAGTSILYGIPLTVAIMIPYYTGAIEKAKAKKINVNIKYMQPADVRGNGNNVAFRIE